MSIFKLIALLATLALVTGCHTVPMPPPAEFAQARPTPSILS